MYIHSQKIIKSAQNLTANVDRYIAENKTLY